MLWTILADRSTSGSVDYKYIHARQVGECLDHEFVTPCAVLLHAMRVDPTLFIGEELLERLPIRSQMLCEALAHYLVLIAWVGERAKEAISIASYGHHPLGGVSNGRGGATVPGQRGGFAF